MGGVAMMRLSPPALLRLSTFVALVLMNQTAVIQAQQVQTKDQWNAHCWQGRSMGTNFSMTLNLPRLVSSDLIERECRAELERLEQIFSLYRDDSELSRLNAADPKTWHPVSTDLARVTARALELSQITGGAFDPTIGPLIRVWRLHEVADTWKPPTADAIAAARERVGARWIEVRLDPPAVRKQLDGIELDLNSLVEGWAIDHLIALMRDRGVENALVELGGEFRAIGTRPDREPWTVGLEDPFNPSRLCARVPLNDSALSTSGDYRQAIIHDGDRYSHIMDPRTGSPIRHECRAVSVLADDAFAADGWATALLVLGPQEGIQLANTHGLAASFAGQSTRSPLRMTKAAQGVWECRTVKTQDLSPRLANWWLLACVLVLGLSGVIWLRTTVS
jgi:thiamine biosynthesis lipoprotein